MKKFLNILGTLLVICVSAQTNFTDTQHYIYTKTCLTGDCTKTSETVQYFDSFGKPFQTVSIKSSPTGKDMVQHIPYDRFGRSVDSWNPVPMSSLGGALQDSSAVKNAAVSVYGDSRPFSHTVLEKSPLGRPISSIPSGQEWQNHPVTMGYYANKANEVKKYTVTTGWTEGRTDDVLSSPGFYPANTLVKTSVTDGDGNKTVEYKNKAGQVVLVKKAVGTTEETDTYYVYNEYNQLSFVIPPLAVNAPMNQATYDKLCYQYRYDGWNRLVEKKVPGKGWEYIIYDQQDRPIMSQDANLRTTDNTFGAKGWMVNKYDKFGRTVYTGFFPSTDSRATLQNNVNNLTVNAENNEARSTTSFTTSGMAVYYTQTAFPAGAITVLQVNYYDTYPAYSFNPSFPTSVFGQEIMTNASNSPLSTKNLPTLSLVKNIEDNNWTKTYVWYDTKGRAISTYAINHLGGYTRTESEINFAGWATQTKVYHKRLTTDTEKQITQTFEYDDQGRLKKKYHQIGSNTQELLAENTYNELSQLVNKKTGNNLQSIDYTYDVRGGLKKINDPANLNGKLFAYGIKTNTPATASSKYNGTITEIDWRTSSDNVLKRYAYQYDGLSRLQKATYSEPNASVPQNDFYNEEITYDLGGNIQTLKRNTKGYLGMKEQIDDLLYTYDANKLQTVADHSANYAGYPDTSGNLITYDDNGNMKSHVDKGVLQIDYNYLNLPKYIKFDNYVNRNGVDVYMNTTYLYRADGVKLKKVYNYFAGRNRTNASQTVEYLDGFQYHTTTTGGGTIPNGLQFIPTSEGYYDFIKSKYIYSYTDHLGNVRLSYYRNTASGSAEVLEENNYYVFGMRQDINILSASNSSYKYQYNGKELQTETGWNDYGARMYMSDIGRWGVIDPLAEQMRRYSPYNYAFNNPVMFIDPDGRKSMIYSDGGIMRWEFDPLTTIYGTSWFENSVKYLNSGGSFFEANGFTGGGGDGSGDVRGPGGAFVDSQLFKDVMAYLAEPGFDFSQFDFSGFGDDITLGKDGRVTNVNQNGKPNRFFDESGLQLFFNDPKGVNKNFVSKTYGIGDRVYYPISIGAAIKGINSVSSNNLIRNFRYTSIFYALIAKESMRANGADFSAGFLSKSIGENGRYVYENDSSYNIRFGNTNAIFSLMDAGNAMWGLWTYSLGVPDHEVKAGSQIYEFLRSAGKEIDSDADQRAIFYFRKMLNKK